MKKILLIFSLIMLFAFPLGAQIAFYIKPTVTMKTNYSRFSTLPHHSSSVNFDPYNPYFTVFNNSLYFDDNNVNLGVHVGVKWKERHFFEVGFSKDNAGTSTSVIGAKNGGIDPLTNEWFNTLGANLLNVGHGYSRISFDYEYNLVKSKNNVVKVNLKLGTGLMVDWSNRPKKGIYKIDTLPTPLIVPIPDEQIYFTKALTTSQGVSRVSPFLTIGGAFTFSTKSNYEIFTLNVFYVQNFKNMQLTRHTASISDHGNINNYKYWQSSRGSGFYFQISRRLQFYPWIPLSKKKREGKIL